MIHNAAIIHSSAKIGDNVEIGPYTVIGENTIIGSGTKIGSGAIIEFAEIGKNCNISGHAVIGTAPQDLKYKGEQTKIIIGDNCSIREFVTLNRGTVASGKTVIGSGCLFMAYSHVAHDCRVGNSVIFANVASLGGHVEVGDFAILGALAGVHQFTRIGKLAMIGGGSMVVQDVIPFCQAQGDRARLVGLNLVGMKRKSFQRETVEDIKAAYKTLFVSGIPMQEALDQIEASSPREEVKQIIDFIHSSKRGVCRHLRKPETEEI